MAGIPSVADLNGAADKSGLGAVETVRVVGAALFIVGALCLAAFLIPHTGTLAMYKMWEYDALFGAQALGILVAAVMLFIRKTQDLGAGLLLGSIPLWFADEISSYRPSELFAESFRANGLCFMGASVCLLAGAILVLLSVTIGRAPAPAAARRRPRSSGKSKSARAARSSRLIVLLVAIAAVAVCVAGRFMTWTDTTLSLATSSSTAPVHSPCCAIADANWWTRTDYLAAAAVLLAVAVVAPVLRSRAMGAGLFFGAGFFLITGIVETAIVMVAPLRSNVTLAQAAAADHLIVTVSPTAGYWVTIAGVVLLLAAGVLRLTLSADRTRYPEAPAPLRAVVAAA